MATKAELEDQIEELKATIAVRDSDIEWRKGVEEERVTEVQSLNTRIEALTQNEVALREEVAELRKVQALVVGQEGATIAELRQRDGTKRLVNPGGILMVAEDGYVEFVAEAMVTGVPVEGDDAPNRWLAGIVDDVAEGLYEALAEQVLGEAAVRDTYLTPLGIDEQVVRMLCAPWQDTAVRGASFADVFTAYDMFNNVSLGPVGVLMNERAAETELRLQIALAMSDEEVETLRALRGGTTVRPPTPPLTQVYNEAPPFAQIDRLKAPY